MKIRYILRIIFLIICIVYGTMLLNTNSIIDDVKYAISYGDINSEIKYADYFRINSKGYKDADIFLMRLGTLHNFKDGKMIVFYDRHYESDNNTYSSPGYDLEIWTIHKTNGEWFITDTEEINKKISRIKRGEFEKNGY